MTRRWRIVVDDDAPVCMMEVDGRQPSRGRHENATSFSFRGRHEAPLPVAPGPKLMINRKTRQGEAIRRVISEAGRPLSPAEILDGAKQESPTLGLATVYRVLKRLVEAGQIAAVQLPGEAPRYEDRSVAAHHHHHFQCDACGRVFDVPGCPGGLEALTLPGFRVDGHELILYGRCASCLQET